VKLYDIAAAPLERGASQIATFIRGSLERGKLTEDAAAELRGRTATTLSLDDLAGAVIVVEAAVERLDLKQELFAKLEALLTPEAILASNTSSLAITAIAAGLAHPERVVGMHFF